MSKTPKDINWAISLIEDEQYDAAIRLLKKLQESSPVSVDINQELVDALKAFVIETKNHPSFAARAHYLPLVEKAEAALSKAPKD